MSKFNIAQMMSQDNQMKRIRADLLDCNEDYEAYTGEQFEDMVASIKKNGVLNPLIVQAKPDGRFYILAGNNRYRCGIEAGLDEFPCVIKENLTDEEAQTYIDETNIFQRGFTNLKISKQAEVIARRHSQMFDADKQKEIQKEIKALYGKADDADDTSDKADKPKGSKLAQVGNEYGLSKNSIARLIRIDKLINDLKPFVNEGTLKMRPAVSISYLTEEHQNKVLELINDGHAIDMKIGEDLKNVEESGKLDDDAIEAIVLGTYKPKKPKNLSVKLKPVTLKKYFAPDTSESEMLKTIEAALEAYFNNQ